MDGTISCRLGRRKPTRQRDEDDFLQVSQFPCLHFEFFFEFNVASLAVQSSRLDAFRIRTPRRRRGNKKLLEKRREKNEERKKLKKSRK
jgi:hypothetical protein